jgi:hypothetical protein
MIWQTDSKMNMAMGSSTQQHSVMQVKNETIETYLDTKE